MKRFFQKVSVLLVLAFAADGLAAQEAGLFYLREIPQVEFAASEIRAAAETKGIKCANLKLAEFPKALQSIRIVLAASETEARELGAFDAGIIKTNAAAESYVISKKLEGLQATYFVIGADPIGAMYGGLDIAEAIKLGALDQLKTGEHAPFIARRNKPEREIPYERADRNFAGDCCYLTQRHFVDRLLDGKPFETSGEDYLRTLAVQEAVYQSAETGQSVEVKPL